LKLAKNCRENNIIVLDKLDSIVIEIIAKNIKLILLLLFSSYCRI